MRSRWVGYHPDLKAALEHLLSSGGKRIRPILAFLTGGMLGAEPSSLISLAAAIEMLHTATLVHDDLIDGALLRRGSPTLNSQWSPAATVLTGDFIFARAAKLSAETNSLPVMHFFAETLATIVNGEVTQLFSSRRLADKEEYYQRIYAKTASLFCLATGAAAMLSPVDDQMIEMMKRLGYSLGMAFQIVDDILDYTGEQAKLGKPVASDLRQGLLTLPALYYYETNPNDGHLATLLAGGMLRDAELEELVNAIRDSGAIERSMEEARRFTQQGLDILAEMPSGEDRQALICLTYYIVDRRL